MDIKNLKYFLTVAQEGTITRAAEALHIAQPPLSRQLQLLEEELGVTLFVRGRRQIQLTDEGRFLKQQAEEIIRLVERTETQLGKIRNTAHGVISIGATEASSAGVLCGLIEEFKKGFPNVSYNVWCGGSMEANDKLSKRLTDINIVREPQDSAHYDNIRIKEEPWIALMSKDCAAALETEDTITTKRLGEEPLIIPSRELLQTRVARWMSEAWQERNVLCYYNTPACILPLVKNGVGIAICPDSVKAFTDSDSFAYRKIVSPEHSSALYAVKLRNQVFPAVTNCFWDFIVERYAKDNE